LEGKKYYSSKDNDGKKKEKVAKVEGDTKAKGKGGFLIGGGYLSKKILCW